MYAFWPIENHAGVGLVEPGDYSLQINVASTSNGDTGWQQYFNLDAFCSPPDAYFDDSNLFTVYA